MKTENSDSATNLYVFTSRHLARHFLPFYKSAIIWSQTPLSSDSRPWLGNFPVPELGEN